MNNGMIRTIVAAITALLLAGAVWSADVYKIVDKDGNVTYTDQPPGDGSQPMVLPELSVIETDIQVDQAPAAGDAKEASGPTARELRKMYRDFSITQPQNEETFWGTANSVVVSWGSEIPPAADMKVRLFVNGKFQNVPATGSVSLTFDRGEHQVYAELRNAQGRRIVASETVTFFVMQHSVR
jgi:hypothetical protein